MNMYKNIKDLGKGLYREVIVPSVIGSFIAFEALVGTQIALNNTSFNQKYQILWPTRAEHYINVSEKMIDTDGNGTADTKITIVPRAGVLEEKINE